MRILAVDDDPIILELLTHFVDAIGNHEITTALSGSKALEIVQSSEVAHFDCFLFDIQMPKMDGIELTKAIRGLKCFADTPILMLTAMTDKRYVDAAFTAGATDYVTKPFELMELTARLNLVEGLVEARQARTTKIFATQKIAGLAQPTAIADVLELYEPLSIYDVDNVIEFMAMENYVAQLSRGDLFGSATFAFSIRCIGEHHKKMSAFEFFSLVSDVAEIISDTLADHQFLMSYAGSGTFVCISECGWQPNMPALMDAVNLSLSRTELYDNSGQKLYVRISAGKAIRLIWKSQSSVMEAISEAHSSAEVASAAHERSMNDLWAVEQRG